MINIIINKIFFIKFDSLKLLPVIIQEILTKTILMFAWLDRFSMNKILILKLNNFYSRSKLKIWLKGFNSLDFQLSKYIYFDCDMDCILLKILQINNIACHLKFKSCFSDKI